VRRPRRIGADGPNGRGVRIDNAGPNPLAWVPGPADLLRGIKCNHGSVINADHLPDDLPIRSLGAPFGSGRAAFSVQGY
jgi:hypothetical protein